MAFQYFAESRVDFGVFEVGLGGRLDATNILTPAISIITTIDFDHENFLGHSLSEIAAEKAGILKRRIPAVIAAQRPEGRDVLLARANKLGCPVVETNQAYRIDDEGLEDGCARAQITELSSGWSARLAPQLAGRFQLQNAMNAVAAARNLAARGYRITQTAIEQGIASAVWPGRLEKLQSRPDIYVDGAHNPGAARELAAFWEENFADRKIFLLYAALRDKAVDEIAGVLFPHAAEVVFTEPRTSRAISASQLSEIAAHHASRSTVIPDAEQALDYLLSKAAPQDAIFVTGSLYLVGQLRHYWKQRAQLAAR
jgi:dihydrofolate synthase/folylpolyglutamate synthase